jgi:predicted nucleic acid-binding protein
VIVLDASALVDVVTDRPRKNAVLDVMDGQAIVAPGHQLAEVSSAISRLLRAEEIDEAAALRALQDAASLTQEVVPTDREQLERAFALRASIRILDGIYVALAERFRCPLVTTDGRLARADPPCEVVVAGGE